MEKQILVINPGSTSTKVAVFAQDMPLFSEEVVHTQTELDACATLREQLPLRMRAIEGLLEERGCDLGQLAAIACRGGTFGRVQGGAYRVDEALLAACRSPKTNHTSNLAAIIGSELGARAGIPVYIYDAVCTDELAPIARLSGLSELPRKANSHVLNTRAVCRALAAGQGRAYQDMNFIAAHIGGGVSLNVHEHGRIVDVVSDDEGPMSPERSGRLNAGTLLKLCLSGKYDAAALGRKLKGQGGLLSHLGTSSVLEVVRRVEQGDPRATLVFEAMAYQIAKGIGELATVVRGNVDAIVLTGGAARSPRLTDLIRERVSFIAPVYVSPGAMEMEALAQGVLRVLEGEETAKNYEREELL